MKVLRETQQLGPVLVDMRAGGKGLGFVPTMGALHAGHMILIERARRENDLLGVSIFVNPLQFGPSEDFEKYPRTEEEDLRLLELAGTDVVLIGKVSDFYPKGYATSVEVSKRLTGDCEGAQRPGHFRGVTTVVAKLFMLFCPDRAYFGWKDMQQFCVLARLVKDLCLPIEMIPCEVVREDDGLAMSSRNRYLGSDDRAKASTIYRGLCEARDRFREGETNGETLCGIVRERLASDFDLDYVEIRDEQDFERVKDPVDRGRIVVAAHLGKTRLLDNLPL